MATSGSFDFDLKTNEIIELSLRRAGDLSDGENPTAAQILIGRKHLNAMTKAWRAEGIYLWTIDWITISMVASSIVLGDDGFDYECIRNHISALDNRPISGAKHPSFWKKLATNTGATWVVDTASRFDRPLGARKPAKPHIVPYLPASNYKRSPDNTPTCH